MADPTPVNHQTVSLVVRRRNAAAKRLSMVAPEPIPTADPPHPSTNPVSPILRPVVSSTSIAVMASSRAEAFEAYGCRFESCRARQFIKAKTVLHLWRMVLAFLVLW